MPARPARAVASGARWRIARTTRSSNRRCWNASAMPVAARTSDESSCVSFVDSWFVCNANAAMLATSSASACSRALSSPVPSASAADALSASANASTTASALPASARIDGGNTGSDQPSPSTKASTSPSDSRTNGRKASANNEATLCSASAVVLTAPPSGEAQELAYLFA